MRRDFADCSGLGELRRERFAACLGERSIELRLGDRALLEEDPSERLLRVVGHSRPEIQGYRNQLGHAEQPELQPRAASERFATSPV